MTRMILLGADTAKDIESWPCAYSVFTGRSCGGRYCSHCKEEAP